MLICDKCASKKFSSTVRKSIQEDFDKQQNQMRKEAYARRLQITKQAYNALTRNAPGGGPAVREISGSAQYSIQNYVRKPPSPPL